MSAATDTTIPFSAAPVREANGPDASFRRDLSDYLNRQERCGATVVRIEQVRRLLAGQETTN